MDLHFLYLVFRQQDEDRARRREEKLAEIEAKKAEKVVRPNEFKYVIIVRTCFRIRLCVLIWPRANSCQIVVRHNRKDLFSDSNVRASLTSCNFVSRT